ncbi:MAG: anti-sigma factor [Anaeromyxobacter sp.]
MTTFTGHLTDSQAQRLVDGALLEAERDMVHAHEAGCLECQALVASYRALSGALDDLEVPELDLDFTGDVLAEIDVRAKAAARERRAAALISAAGVVAFLVAAGLTVPQWGDAVVRSLDVLGSVGAGLRFALEVATPVVSALRLPIAVVCALVAAPALLALSRLMPAPATETA